MKFIIILVIIFLAACSAQYDVYEVNVGCFETGNGWGVLSGSGPDNLCTNVCQKMEQAYEEWNCVDEKVRCSCS